MESSSGTAKEATPSSCVALANTPCARRARDGDARGSDARANRRPVRIAHAETGEPWTGRVTRGDAARRARTLATGDPRVATPDIVAEIFAASMARRCARRAPCEAACLSERFTGVWWNTSPFLRGWTARRASCCAVPAKKRALIGPPPGTPIPRFTTQEKSPGSEKSSSLETKSKKIGAKVWLFASRSLPRRDRPARLFAQRHPLPDRSIRTVTGPSFLAPSRVRARERPSHRSASNRRPRRSRARR